MPEDQTALPPWAIEEAHRRAREEAAHQPGASYSDAIIALARALARYEEPPVDVATRLTREVLARYFETDSEGKVTYNNNAAQVRRGLWDRKADFQRVRSAIAEALGR